LVGISYLALQADGNSGSKGSKQKSLPIEWAGFDLCSLQMNSRKPFIDVAIDIPRVQHPERGCVNISLPDCSGKEF
jgi:hypothetical protein